MAEIIDPRYGKIGDLCAELGYAQFGVRGHLFNSFRKEIIDFRKSFIETHNVTDFPFDIAAPVVRYCADMFLVARGVTVFPASHEAEDGTKLPHYPQDRDKIFDALTKLICQQEYRYRVNDAYLSQKKENAIVDDEPEPELEQIKSSRSPSAFSLDSEPTASSIPRPVRTYIRVNDQQRQEITLSNTKIHLDWVYPLDTVPSYRQSRSPAAWLTQKRLRVERIKKIDPFAFRYLHERSLYRVNQANSEQIIQFAIDAANEYKLTSEEQLLTPTQARCERLIVMTAKYFNKDGFGFLYDENGVTKKTKEFEAAWRLRRTQWLEKWHHRSSQNVIECLDLSENNNTKRKRSSPVNSYPNQPSSYSCSKAYPKRRRTQDNAVGEDAVNPSSGPTRDSSQREEGSRVHDHIPVHQNPLISKETSARYSERHKSPTSSSLGNPPPSRPFGPPSSHSTLVNMSEPSPSQRVWVWQTQESNTEIPGLRAISQTIDALDTEDFERSVGMAPIAQMNASTRSPGTNHTSTSMENGEEDTSLSTSPCSIANFYDPQEPELQNEANTFLDVSKISQGSIDQPGETSVPRAPEPSPSRHDSSARLTPPELNESLPAVTKEPLSLPNTESLPPSPVSMNSVSNVVPKDHQLSVAKPKSVEPPTPASPDTAYRHSGPFPGSRQSLLPTQEQTTSLVRLSSGPMKPKLVFAVEDDSGMCDNEPESLFSKKSIFGLSHKELFTFVCNRSGVDLVDLQQISFKCQWEKAGLVVEKITEEAEAKWIRQRRRLNAVFVGAQKEFPDLMVFEVWIMCGDRVTKKKKKIVSKNESESDD